MDDKVNQVVTKWLEKVFDGTVPEYEENDFSLGVLFLLAKHSTMMDRFSNAQIAWADTAAGHYSSEG